MPTREQLLELDLVPVRAPETARKEIDHLFDDEEELPVMLGRMEEHDAWKEDLLQMVEDPSTKSGYRYTGPRRVGERMLDADGNPLPETAWGDDPKVVIDEDDVVHPLWSKDG